MESTIARLRALADPVRFAIAEALAAGVELCACDLLERFTISQPTLSHHMKVLCAAGLVRSRKEGTWMHYALDRASFSGLSVVFGALAAAPGDESAGSCLVCGVRP